MGVLDVCLVYFPVCFVRDRDGDPSMMEPTDRVLPTLYCYLVADC